MENIIISRAVLVALVLFHLFVGYGARAVGFHINRHLLNCIFIIELIAVTAFIVYDNVCNPIQGSKFWPIVGYLFVYFMIWITWFLYRPNGILDKDISYKFVADKPVEFVGEKYMSGYTEVRGNLEAVLLPFNEYPGIARPVRVKFAEVIDVYIIVTADKTCWAESEPDGFYA